MKLMEEKHIYEPQAPTSFLLQDLHQFLQNKIESATADHEYFADQEFRTTTKEENTENARKKRREDEKTGQGEVTK